MPATGQPASSLVLHCRIDVPHGVAVVEPPASEHAAPWSVPGSSTFAASL